MRRKKAFTIIETVIGLMILGLIAFTITLINPMKKTYNQKNIHAADFQAFLNNIQSRKKHYVLYSHVGKLIAPMLSKESGKKYEMYQNNKMIIISGVSGGYYPILDDVKSINFKELKNHLAIKVVFSNDESYEDVSSISYD